MIRKIQRRWFEVWGDAEAQNGILKYLLLLLTVFCTAELIMICALAFKKPLIISVTNEKTATIEQSEPNSDALMREIIRAIKNYLKTRHNWDWTTIEAQTKSGAQYLAPDFREKYLIRSQEQIRLSKEKQVAQKLFVDEPEIDLKNKKAVVKTERILIVNGIRAAQELVFEISYSLGARTESNPEGIYIVSDELQNARPQ